jgi:hypothetical protein
MKIKQMKSSTRILIGGDFNRSSTFFQKILDVIPNSKIYNTLYHHTSYKDNNGNYNDYNCDFLLVIN